MNETIKNSMYGVVKARSVDKTGILINEDWYNFDEKNSKISKAGIQTILKGLNKGDKIMLELSDMKHYTAIKIEERAEIKSKGFDDYNSLANLIQEAKKEGITFTTECLRYDVPGKFAFFKATAEKKGEKHKIGEVEGYKAQVWTAHGDADATDLESHLKPHWFRMAESRAIARVLRFALGKGETTKEEFEGTLEPDKLGTNFIKSEE